MPEKQYPVRKRCRAHPDKTMQVTRIATTVWDITPKIDQSLLRFEEALTQMAKNGQIDLPIDDEFAEIILNGLEPVDLTENEFRKLSADMRVAHQDRAKALKVKPKDLMK